MIFVARASLQLHDRQKVERDRLVQPTRNHHLLGLPIARARRVEVGEMAKRV